MMEKFLYKVAKDLKCKVGNDMANTAVIFPNKRAALFFNKYLVEDEKFPIWSPKYMTISELFREIKPGVTVPDTLELVCRLYNTYKKVVKSKQKDNKQEDSNKNIIESLDHFYQWGETLLSDFDDVDKNMANAQKLFTHLNDWNQLEASDFIEPEMEERIKNFFSSFSVENMSELRRRFLEIWENLYDIYEEFKKDLENEGMTYEGALYRSVAESLDENQLIHDNYVFVGFNVLDNVEKSLFEKIQEAGKAIFYWDYNPRYMSDTNEAGMFLRSNMEKFPNALEPAKENGNDTSKEIIIISSKTDSIQAQYTRQWVENNLTDPESDTAIVLCNEKQLQPVLHSIPDNVKCINVTMGYPLSETPAMSFIRCCINMQSDYDSDRKAYSYTSVAALLKHPYTKLISANAEKDYEQIKKDNIFYPTPQQLSRSQQDDEPDKVLEILFTPQKKNIDLCRYLAEVIKTIAQHYKELPGQTEEKDNEAEAEKKMYRQLYGESLFKIYTTLTRFSNLIETEQLIVERLTLIRLLDRVLQGINIPFHGEPAVGLQLMGMLETRNLDFKHLIMLGVNEGMLPKASEIPSFIPNTIRQAFGMTTIDRRIAVFAYYFYRLLQYSEKVYLLYNDETNNGQKGEMSRFLLQLIAESDENISVQTLDSNVILSSTQAISIPRTAETVDVLKRRYECKGNDNTGNEVGWIKNWLKDHKFQKPHRNNNTPTNSRLLSASAINTYLECQLRFYFKYIAGLKVKEEVSMDIESSTFGTIFHNTAEEIYNRLTEKNSSISKTNLENILKIQGKQSATSTSDNIQIEPIVDFYFRKEFFKQKEVKDIDSYKEVVDRKITLPEVSYNGIQLINKEVIVRLIKKLLRLDIELGDFNYLGSETFISRTEEVTLKDSSKINVKVGGFIDRIDCVKDTKSGKDMIRIVDYKTGTSKPSAKNIEAMFTPGKTRSGYHLQTFLYASIFSDLIEKTGKVAPALLFIQTQETEKSPLLKIDRNEVNDFFEYKDEFDTMLRQTISEIFSKEGSYEQTEFEDKCQYCDFKKLCKKNV